MKETTVTTQCRPDYGLDAPGLQRAFLYGGVAGVIAGRMLADRGVMGNVGWQVTAGTSVLWTGLSFFLAGCVMYWGSRVGKLRLRDTLLSSISWRGDEQVLDVGCGHGILLIGAAKRLQSGHAVGIDIWSQRDQKDNRPEATLHNARCEGVAERIEVKDADARKLPFPDDCFDVVLSSFAIHNISGSDGRDTAIREIARVLKPGGRLAMADIGYTKQYEKILQSLGWQTQLGGPNLMFVTPTRVLRASKP